MSVSPSPEVCPGGVIRDLRGLLSTAVEEADESKLDSAVETIFQDLVDEVALGLCFDIHRSVKTGVFALTEIPEGRDPGQTGSSSSNSGATDVFGQVVTTSVGVPMLKKQPECVCPNCQRNLAASRFAPHLEKCMGMGRNSSRLASRRLATNSKDSYRESGGHDDEDDAEDEDWIEPNRGGSSGGSSGAAGSYGGGSAASRRRRDKNSPRRNRGNKSGARSSGDTTPQEGSITPPTSYDQLSLEERSQWLSTICGVVSVTSRKICSRSTRCPVHTDLQRREVRIRWLSMNSQEAGEDGHVDIDSFTEGDTAALRESLAQLSNASSPTESVISTSSNPSSGAANTRSAAAATVSSSTGGRREKGSRRGKKGKPGSKSGSRGSTPPLMQVD